MYDIRAGNGSSQYEIATTKHLNFGRHSYQRSPELPESALSLYTKQDVNTEADEFHNLMSESAKGHESKHGTAKK